LGGVLGAALCSAAACGTSNLPSGWPQSDGGSDAGLTPDSTLDSGPDASDGGSSSDSDGQGEGAADGGTESGALDSSSSDSPGDASAIDSSSTEASGSDSGDAATEAAAPAWSSGDIGPVTAPGSWCLGDGCVPAEASGTFLLSGSGADLGLCDGGACGMGTTDQFYYVYQSVTGDATITAHVTSIAMVTDWSKAFISMRDGLVDDAAFVSLAVPAAGYGYYWFYRSSLGAALAFPQPPMPGGTPVWFRIVRRGNVFTGSYSSDGIVWNQVASMTFTMSPTLQVGLAVVSRLNGTLTTGSFDHVSLTTP
jgi:hypothetical protein